jgi:hypothetical protein
MTRLISLLILAFLLLPALPAHAGTVTATDGNGSWVSTKCTAPQYPTALPNNPEIDADSLNGQMMLYNQYVAQTDAYMNCVSQEAQSDAASSGQVIIRAAQAIIQQTQAQVTAKAAGLQSN